MAKRKKRKAPKRRRVAAPKPIDGPLSFDDEDELEGEEAEGDIEEPEPDTDTEEELEDDEHVPAKPESASAAKTASSTSPAAPSSAMTKGGAGYETREAPASAGLWIMGFIFGLMVVAALVMKFLG